VGFIENQVGHAVASRCYTDTGPILERELAQRAGLGWIGKNTCLINPRLGSYFLLAEILLDIDLEPDAALLADHCGSCTRCLHGCPTGCILPDRTIDAGRCISYLTIELRESIPHEVRALMGAWIFGCDLCQMVCPWNRFAALEGDAAFMSTNASPDPRLREELALSPEALRRRFKTSPINRAKLSGYRRNVAVALGNAAGPEAIPALQTAVQNGDALLMEHAAWAIQRITEQTARDE
jgi:epoxyqueuosine reductase